MLSNPILAEIFQKNIFHTVLQYHVLFTMKLKQWLAFILFSCCVQAYAASLTFTDAERAILSNPDTLLLFRLNSMNFSPMMMAPLELHGQRVSNSMGALSDELKELVIQTFPHQKEFRTTIQTDCPFKPGVGLKFMQGKESLAILLCYSCEEWAFQRNGRMVYADLGGDKAALINFALKAFPYDEEIQQLK